MVKIIGVDFSGAQTDKNTWITEAELNSVTRTLKLDVCESIQRNKLTERLKKYDYSVAAMDFPFSVPKTFAEYLGHPSSKMHDLWACIADMCLNEFIAKRNCFVGDDKKREYLRAGDLHVSGCYSCLHDTNPNMVPMTFYGMRMLHQLHTDQSGRGFEVPPLQGMGTRCPVLLEVMPGAVLHSLGLPEKNPGKAYKKPKDETAKERRKEILGGLEQRSKIKLPNLAAGCYSKGIENHDCLDSLVAAVAAAMWALDKSQFRCPSKTRTVRESGASPQRLQRGSPGIKDFKECDAARLEGWLYAPTPIRQNSSQP